LGLLLNNFVAAGDAGCEVIDIALVHLALSLMILFALQMFREIIEQHLHENIDTVILLFRGSNSGSISIFRTL
jgi:hypothetical protein